MKKNCKKVRKRKSTSSISGFVNKVKRTINNFTVLEPAINIYHSLSGLSLRDKAIHLLSIPVGLSCYLLPDKPTLVTYPGGKMYLNLHEYPTMIARKIGTYEKLKTEFIKTFLKERDTFIDVGSSKGYFTILAANTMNDKGVVVSIEPDEKNHELISKSLAENDIDCVHYYDLACSDSKGSFRFYPGKKSGWGSHIRSHNTLDSYRIVKSDTLDSIIRKSGLDSVSLIKIDTEGHEFEVIKGSVNTLTCSPAIVLLIDIHPTTKHFRLYDFLISKGFQVGRLTHRGVIPVGRADMHRVFDIISSRDLKSLNKSLRWSK